MSAQRKTAPVREDVGAVQASDLVNAHSDFTTVYEVPAGVRVFAVSEQDAKRGQAWGRLLKFSRTSRVNTFTAEDLVEARPIGYLFRLPLNRYGYALLMVPAEHVIRKDQPQ